MAGTYRPDRHRAREGAPDGGAPLDPHRPPLHLSLRRADLWREIVEQLPPRVAVTADTVLLEQLVGAVDAAREAAKHLAVEGYTGIGSTGAAVPSHWFKIEMQAMDKVARICAEIGLTPQSRLRLADGMPPKEAASAKDDKWAAFASVEAAINRGPRRSDA
jgi:P27 family predicted phage terminase small subunit